MAKRTVLKVFSLVCILLFSSALVFGVVWGNDSDSGYGGGGKSSTSIREYVIQGAGYFLNAHADIFLFSNKVELAELNGVNYAEMQQIMAAAVQAMADAETTYSTLVQIADGTPYNSEIIAKLIAFDYDTFQQQNGLNAEIFAQVKEYLGKGDIRGVYYRMLSDIRESLALLGELKAAVDAYKFPDISVVWHLNQTVSQSFLFGQDVSMVFHTIIYSESESK